MANKTSFPTVCSYHDNFLVLITAIKYNSKADVVNLHVMLKASVNM